MSALKVVSLGWGIQSFTLAAMVALGELEPVAFAIHANTTHEFSGTYAFAAKWTPWLEERGVKVVTVRNEANPIPDNKVVDIPAFTIGKHNMDGQLNRHCTGDWKIAPMRRHIQSIRAGQPVEQWIGISLDEFQRMRDSDVKYITNRYPLVEKRMTRNDCVKWLLAHGLEVPPKSACTFCPFHSAAEWRKIKASPADWLEAVTVDRAIRRARPPYDLFVHSKRIPLEDVDLRTPEEKGQMSIFDEPDENGECSGVCFI
jgi:hypothetical protein